MINFRTCFSALWRHLGSVRLQVCACALIRGVGAAASLVFVLYSKRVVDIATGLCDSPLRSGILVLLGIMILRIVCAVAASYYEGRLVINAKNRIRSQVFDKALRSTWTGQEKFHSADAANRMEEDLRVITEFVCVSVPDAIVTLLQLIAAVAMLFSFSSSLAWILIWIMPVAVVAARLYFKRIRRLTGEIRTIDGRINGLLQENLQHRILVKTLSGEERIEAGLDALQQEEKAKTVERLGYSSVSRAFMNAGFSLGYLLAFVWGVVGLKDGSVTYGLMVAFLQLVGQVQRPVANLAQYLPVFIRALSSEERLLDIENLPQEKHDADILLAGAPGLKVDNLNFAYSGRAKAVFENFSFVFPAGKMTVITGPTGEGKSTLIQLLLALLEPSSGQIVLCGEDGKCIPASPSARCNFMYVPQGNSLMSGSIRDNLLMAKAYADESELRECLHVAAADFVWELPLGLETSCSEIGRGLSEGQAQRIAIARALLKPGGVLILDEATSALDAETESAVLERIQSKYKGQKTIICVTHRPAAIALADCHLSL